MQLYKIIYTKSTIEGTEITTDDMMIVEEIVVGEEDRNTRLQELVNQGKSPVYRKVDAHGNIIG